MRREVDQTVRSVCDTCSQRLDATPRGQREPVPPVDDRRRTDSASPGRRRLLARWAAKTAVVMECACDPPIRTPRSACEYLRRIGVHPGTQVLVGRYDGEHASADPRARSVQPDDRRQEALPLAIVVRDRQASFIQVFADPWRDSTPELEERRGPAADRARFRASGARSSGRRDMCDRRLAAMSSCEWCASMTTTQQLRTTRKPRTTTRKRRTGVTKSGHSRCCDRVRGEKVRSGFGSAHGVTSGPGCRPAPGSGPRPAPRSAEHARADQEECDPGDRPRAPASTHRGASPRSPRPSSSSSSLWPAASSPARELASRLGADAVS